MESASTKKKQRKRRMTKVERRAAKRARLAQKQKSTPREPASIAARSTSAILSKKKKDGKRKSISHPEHKTLLSTSNGANRSTKKLSDAAKRLMGKSDNKGTLSDRLNPKHPFFDQELKTAWKSILSKFDRKEMVRMDREKLENELKAVASIVHPFDANMDDHCESPLEAYKDVAPVLRRLATKLGKKPSELRIYDPYFCAGAVARHLDELGFPNVYNKCEDFYRTIATASVPDHDVLVTNPPYSDYHLRRLLRFCRKNEKPFLLLLPNYVCKKDFYREALKIDCSHERHEEPTYLTPRRRYMYWTPKGLHRRSRTQNHASSLGFRTSPFVSFWYIDLSPAISKREFSCWYQKKATALYESAAPIISLSTGRLPRSCRED